MTSSAANTLRITFNSRLHLCNTCVATRVAIYLCLVICYKFKCNFNLILLSTEDGGCWATETCIVNLNVSSFS